MKIFVLHSVSIGILCANYVIAFAFTSYTPFNKSLLSPSSFFEQFDYERLNDSNWKVSQAVKDDHTTYDGVWDLATAKVFPGFSGDKALTLKTPASHFAISYALDEPFDNANNDLVLQYEVKAQKDLNCAGAYIKLLDYEFTSNDSNGDLFNYETPYQIMFGPDKCGHSNKIHFIIKRENPFTKKMEEKHLTLPPLSRSGKLSTLYTLILKSNLDFEIRVNGDVAKAGNLIDDPTLLNPTLTPPKEVIDINDVQPEDWDDVEFIPDPEITEKPADYDEKFYFHHIEDPNAVKPDTWEESEVELIVDPNSERPNDWDDEEDGEWEGPLIKNPKCISNGCGKWTPPKIPNPNYIGPWVQPVIPNPNYQGEWVPRMIPNKYYYEDLTPSNLKLIGGIGFELWSMDNDLMFDNIYLGHSVEEAQLIGNETFITKERLERASFEANRPKAKNEPSPPPKNFEDLLRDDDESRLTQFIVFLKHYLLTKYLDVKDFIDEFRDNPIETIVNNPLKFVGYCVGFVFIFTFSFGMISVFLFLLSGGVDHPDKSSNLPKNIEEISKEEEANGALTSGFESSLSEPSKRK